MSPTDCRCGYASAPLAAEASTRPLRSSNAVVRELGRDRRAREVLQLTLIATLGGADRLMEVDGEIVALRPVRHQRLGREGREGADLRARDTGA